MNYRLAFTINSKKRGCGVADVIPADGHNVWGVVYKLSLHDIETSLDEYEDYVPSREESKNLYVRKKCVVFRDGYDSVPFEAWCYFANPEPGWPFPTSEHYKELLLNGAISWELPHWYIDELREIETHP